MNDVGGKLSPLSFLERNIMDVSAPESERLFFDMFAIAEFVLFARDHSWIVCKDAMCSERGDALKSSPSTSDSDSLFPQGWFPNSTIILERDGGVAPGDHMTVSLNLQWKT